MNLASLFILRDALQCTITLHNPEEKTITHIVATPSLLNFSYFPIFFFQAPLSAAATHCLSSGKEGKETVACTANAPNWSPSV